MAPITELLAACQHPDLLPSFANLHAICAAALLLDTRAAASPTMPPQQQQQQTPAATFAAAHGALLELLLRFGGSPEGLQGVLAAHAAAALKVAGSAGIPACAHPTWLDGALQAARRAVGELQDLQGRLATTAAACAVLSAHPAGCTLQPPPHHLVAAAAPLPAGDPGAFAARMRSGGAEGCWHTRGTMHPCQPCQPGRQLQPAPSGDGGDDGDGGDCVCAAQQLSRDGALARLRAFWLQPAGAALLAQAGAMWAAPQGAQAVVTWLVERAQAEQRPAHAGGPLSLRPRGGAAARGQWLTLACALLVQPRWRSAAALMLGGDGGAGAAADVAAGGAGAGGVVQVDLSGEGEGFEAWVAAAGQLQPMPAEQPPEAAHETRDCAALNAALLVAVDTLAQLLRSQAPLALGAAPAPALVAACALHAQLASALVAGLLCAAQQQQVPPEQQPQLEGLLQLLLALGIGG